MSLCLPAMAGIGLLLAGLLLPATAEAMRCGNKIVSKGDVQAKVLRYCGEPVTVNTRYAERGGYLHGQRQRTRLALSDGAVEYGGRYRYGPYYRTEIVIEDWVYNLGPRKLMRRITFENGVVTKVATLGRGYRE